MNIDPVDLKHFIACYHEGTKLEPDPNGLLTMSYDDCTMLRSLRGNTDEAQQSRQERNMKACKHVFQRFTPKCIAPTIETDVHFLKTSIIPEKLSDAIISGWMKDHFFKKSVPSGNNVIDKSEVKVTLKFKFSSTEECTQAWRSFSAAAAGQYFMSNAKDFPYEMQGSYETCVSPKSKVCCEQTMKLHWQDTQDTGRTKKPSDCVRKLPAAPRPPRA